MQSQKTRLRLLKTVGVLSLSLLLGCSQEKGFEAHLLEAIHLYEERKIEYSLLTQGESDGLFDALINTEKASLLVARIFDLRAKKFNDAGIPVVKNDFVPIIPPGTPSNPIAYASELDIELEDRIFVELSTLKALYGSDNFREITNETARVLTWLKEFEKSHNIYAPMTKHLLESIGYASLHAIEYACNSNGDTTQLSKDLVSLQILTINRLTFGFDRSANKFHMEGIGILVSDLPEIPFLEELSHIQDSSTCSF